MAIAFNASALGTAGTATWSHTCTGSNLILIVAIYDKDSNVTGVTYNGTSMTLLTSLVTNGATNYMYYLINPSTGANNVSVSKTSGTNYRGASTSYTGVKQSGQPDSFNSGTSATSPVNVSTTVVASNCWLVMSGTEQSSIAASPSTNKTNRQTGNFTAVDSYGIVIADSNATVATGSNTVIFSKGGGGSLFAVSGIVASIAEATASVRLLNLLGVGT